MMAWRKWRHRATPRELLEDQLPADARWHSDVTVELQSGSIGGLAIDLWLVARRWDAMPTAERELEVGLVSRWLSGEIAGTFERLEAPMRSLRAPISRDDRIGVAVTDNVRVSRGVILMIDADVVTGGGRGRLVVDSEGGSWWEEPTGVSAIPPGWTPLALGAEGRDSILRPLVETDLVRLIADASADIHAGPKIGGLPRWVQVHESTELLGYGDERFVLQIPLAELSREDDTVIYLFSDLSEQPTSTVILEAGWFKGPAMRPAAFRVVGLAVRHVP